MARTHTAPVTITAIAVEVTSPGGPSAATGRSFRSLINETRWTSHGSRAGTYAPLVTVTYIFLTIPSSSSFSFGLLPLRARANSTGRRTPNSKFMVKWPGLKP